MLTSLCRSLLEKISIEKLIYIMYERKSLELGISLLCLNCLLLKLSSHSLLIVGITSRGQIWQTVTTTHNMYAA